MFTLGVHRCAPRRQVAGEEAAGLWPGQGNGTVEPYGAVGPLLLGVGVVVWGRADDEARAALERLSSSDLQGSCCVGPSRR